MAKTFSFFSVLKLMQVVAAAVILLGVSAQTAQAATYYVSTTGNNSNAGTEAQPWRNVQYAAGRVVAGDTVIIRAGYYSEQITPTNSGTQNAPITYRAYQNERPAIGGQLMGLNLTNKQWLVFDGITIRDTGYDVGGYTDHWILMDNTHHVTLNNMIITFTNGPRAANFQGIYIIGGSSYNRIMNSTIENWGLLHHSPPNDIGGDAVQVAENSHHNLFENNTFGRADHASLQIMEGHHNVIRNNRFYNDAEKALEITDRRNGGTYRNLLEGNTVYGSGFNVEDHGGLCMHFASSNSIVRRNTFRDCGLWAFGCYVWGQVNGSGDITYSCRDNRFYNNVMAHNMIDPNGYSGGLNTYEGTGARLNDDGPGSGPVRDNVYKNNIFYKNQANNAVPDPNNPGRNIKQLEINIEAQSDRPMAGNRIAGNIFFYNSANDQVLEVAGVGPNNVAYFNQNFPQFFWGNLQVEPQFVTFNPGVVSNPTDGSYDFHLRSTSPAIDAGVDLTNTRSAGSGTSIPVQDARYFSDGFDGIMPADQITVGTETVTVRSTDLTNNTITVDRSISWAANARVNLVYNGNAPDIGAFETGVTAPPTSPSPSPLVSPTPSPTPSPSPVVSPSPSPSPNLQCRAADVVQDGVVAADDRQVILNSFFQRPPSIPRADVNGDGVVDVVDYAIVAKYFGQSCQ